MNIGFSMVREKEDLKKVTGFCAQPPLMKENKKSQGFHREESQVENYPDIMPSEERLRRLENST